MADDRERPAARRSLTIVGIALLDYRFIQQMALPVYLLNLVALVALRFTRGQRQETEAAPIERIPA